MDECALDTTRQKRKVLCSKEELNRLFQITPEGDGKMGIHITLALTSRADGTKSINLFIIFSNIICLFNKEVISITEIRLLTLADNRQ